MRDGDVGRPAADPTVAVLRGAAHPELGTIAVASAGPALAIATSAGARRKRPPPLEPNEDACAVVRGRRGDLLVVADAHHGSMAGSLAVDMVLERLGADPPPANLPEEELEDLFYEICLAVARKAAEPASPQPRSRTTLTFALAADGLVQWATFGDSLVIVGDERSVEVLGTARSAYLGHSFVRPEVQTLLGRGVRTLRGTEYLVLATDGISGGGQPGTVDVLRAAFRERLGAAECVHRLLTDALRAGVGDAVSVAVASP